RSLHLGAPLVPRLSPDLHASLPASVCLAAWPSGARAPAVRRLGLPADRASRGLPGLAPAALAWPAEPLRRLGQLHDLQRLSDRRIPDCPLARARGGDSPRVAPCPSRRASRVRSAPGGGRRRNNVRPGRSRDDGGGGLVLHRRSARARPPLLVATESC